MNLQRYLPPVLSNIVNDYTQKYLYYSTKNNINNIKLPHEAEGINLYPELNLYVQRNEDSKEFTFSHMNPLEEINKIIKLDRLSRDSKPYIFTNNYIYGKGERYGLINNKFEKIDSGIIEVSPDDRVIIKGNGRSGYSIYWGNNHLIFPLGTENFNAYGRYLHYKDYNEDHPIPVLFDMTTNNHIPLEKNFKFIAFLQEDIIIGYTGQINSIDSKGHSNSDGILSALYINNGDIKTVNIMVDKTYDEDTLIENQIINRNYTSGGVTITMRHQVLIFTLNDQGDIWEIRRLNNENGIIDIAII